MWQRESCKRLFIRYCLTTNSFLIVETAAVNLKPLALSLSKGEQAYGLRQAQPERLFQEQRGRLNNNMALNLAPFSRWTMRDKAAQRRLAQL